MTELSLGVTLAVLGAGLLHAGWNALLKSAPGGDPMLDMPFGRPVLAHAFIGGATATLLWEAARHVLRWYFTSVSQVGVVYGSLSSAIVALLSLEIAAIVLLLGAQVIAEYERFSGEAPAEPIGELHTD